MHAYLTFQLFDAWTKIPRIYNNKCKNVYKYICGSGHDLMIISPCKDQIHGNNQDHSADMGQSHGLGTKFWVKSNWEWVRAINIKNISHTY